MEPLTFLIPYCTIGMNNSDATVCILYAVSFICNFHCGSAQLAAAFGFRRSTGAVQFAQGFSNMYKLNTGMEE